VLVYSFFKEFVVDLNFAREWDFMHISYTQIWNWGFISSGLWHCWWVFGSHFSKQWEPHKQQHFIPENQNPQPHCCDNLISYKTGTLTFIWLALNMEDYIVILRISGKKLNVKLMQCLKWNGWY